MVSTITLLIAVRAIPQGAIEPFFTLVAVTKTCPMSESTGKLGGPFLRYRAAQNREGRNGREASHGPQKP